MGQEGGSALGWGGLLPGWGLPAGGPVLLEEPSQIAMLSQPIAIAPDVDDVTMMDQTIDQCGRHDVIAEDLAPVLKALVARQDRGRVLVAATEQLEEEH